MIYDASSELDFEQPFSSPYFEPRIFEEILQEHRDILDDWYNRFRPWIIEVDAEYAKFVEYGTAPCSRPPPTERPKKALSKSDRDNPYMHSPYHSKSRDQIREWVATKLGIRDPVEWERTSYLIWRKIMMNGKAPSPFARPAMDDTIAAIDNGQFDFKRKDLTSYEIALWTRDRMEAYLINPKDQIAGERVMKTSWTGHLLNSIHIVEAPPDFPTISINIIEEMDDEVVRDSTTLAYDF